MLAQFSIFPMDAVHTSKDVAEVVRKLEEAGLEYRLGPMGTSVEGDWDDVLAAVRACHEAVSADHERVVTTITIDDRRDGGHHLDEMVSSVEQSLGHSAKH